MECSNELLAQLAVRLPDVALTSVPTTRLKTIILYNIEINCGFEYLLPC